MTKQLYAVAVDCTPNAYLTRGRRYPIELDGRNTPSYGRGFYLETDDGQETFALERRCLHLRNGDWRIVDENGDPA